MDKTAESDDLPRFRKASVRLRTAPSIADPSYVLLFEEWARCAPADVRDDVELVARLSVACLKGEHELPPPEPEYHAASRRIDEYLLRVCDLEPMAKMDVSPETRARATAAFAARGIRLRLRE